MAEETAAVEQPKCVDFSNKYLWIDNYLIVEKKFLVVDRPHVIWTMKKKLCSKR